MDHKDMRLYQDFKKGREGSGLHFNGFILAFTFQILKKVREEAGK